MSKSHRHKWDAIAAFNDLTGVRKCKVCGERQVKRGGKWVEG
jgi:hypothetical protein